MAIVPVGYGRAASGRAGSSGVEELIGALADLAASLEAATSDLDAPSPA
ncbi:hypothetical protein [Arthrobacter sp. ov407]|nr:hypothetical protein [Arthrobacter sp. ov407]